MERRKVVSAHEGDEASIGNAEEPAHDEAAELEELRRRIEALRVDLTQADRRMRVLLRQRPVLAVAAALAIGFLLGRVISRI